MKHERCPIEINLSGSIARCVYDEGHDGLHRVPAPWDKGYVEWWSGDSADVEFYNGPKLVTGKKT